MANVRLDTLNLDEPELQTFMAENKITTKIIANQGPSGWPLVEYHGNVNRLKEMIHFFWMDDYLYRGIKA